LWVNGLFLGKSGRHIGCWLQEAAYYTSTILNIKNDGTDTPYGGDDYLALLITGGWGDKLARRKRRVTEIWIR
jgi:hypothetical protein